MSKAVTETEMVVLPFEIKAIIARRATLKEWQERDKEASRLPIGSVVVEVDRRLSPEFMAQFGIRTLDIQTLVDSGVATAYLVEDYAKADGRPLCKWIGHDSAIADLPLLPMLLSELPITAER